MADEKSYIKKIKTPAGSTYYIRDEQAYTVLGATSLPADGDNKGKTHQQRIASAESAIASLAAGGLTYNMVASGEQLPTATKQTMGKIYLKSATTTGTNNIYNQYMTVTSDSGATYTWQLIGTTEVDLTDYAKKGQGVTSSGNTDSAQTGISISSHLVSGTISTSTSYTPSGTISASTTGTTNYTPTGTLSGGAISVIPSTTSQYVVSDSTKLGSVTAGVAATCTLPVFSTTVSEETLSFSWTSGSFSANTPTTVTLPSFTTQTIVTDISSATISTLPTFTGTGVNMTFNGSASTITTTGDASTMITIDNHSIEDNGHTHSITSLAGTINNT